MRKQAENSLHKAVVSGSVLGSQHGAVLWASPILEAHMRLGTLPPCKLWSQDEIPSVGIWIWEGCMLQEGTQEMTLRGTWRLPNLIEWDYIHKGHNPCLATEKPAETALDVMFTVAVTLLGMESDKFIQDFVGDGISVEDLLNARDALSTVCYTDEPDQVCIGWVPSMQKGQTRKDFLKIVGQDSKERVSLLASRNS